MNIKDMIFLTAGGLGLFLIGMGMMSDGLKEAAGQRLKKILESMTRKPLIGFLTGTMITALVQSSSATTVMVIGLVNAGLLNLRQAICVVFGTNVGTTATAWIVSLTGLKFKITNLVLPLIAVGFLVQVLSKSRKGKSVGSIFIGFSILFIGINFMQGAFDGIEESEGIRNLLISLGHYPLLAMLAGVVMTMLIQSSSASIAIIQVLAISGAFGDDWTNVLNISIPFVLGSDIGTTITAQIASLQTGVWGKRTAWSHTLFNVIGSSVALPFVYTGLFTKLIISICSMWFKLGPDTIAAAIAIANTLFKVGCSAMFLPFAGVMEKAVCKIVKGKTGDDELKPIVLESHLLETPVIALSQAKQEIVRMAKKAKRAVDFSCKAITKNDRSLIQKTEQFEDLVDEFQHEITSYLVTLSRKHLSEELSSELPVLLHTVNDLERIGDHAINIAEIAQRKIDGKVKFSDTAMDEAKELITELKFMFNGLINALEQNKPEMASGLLESEKKINNLQISFRRKHVKRMTQGNCAASTGIIFIDLVDNIEKIGDHLTNIAQSIMGGLQWEGFEHLKTGKEMNSASILADDQ